MKAIGLALGVAVSGCLDNNDITVDEVIKSLAADDHVHVADGHTPISITICTDGHPGLDPMLKATLKTSAGQWPSPDTDPKATTFAMSTSCATRQLTPTNDPSVPVVMSGTIGNYTRQTTIALTAAIVGTPVLSRMGSIGSMGTSTITITATLPVANNGLPSVGTQVDFVVENDRSDAYFQSASVFVTASSGSTVSSNLLIAQGAPVPIDVHVEVDGTTSTSETLKIEF